MRLRTKLAISVISLLSFAILFGFPVGVLCATEISPTNPTLMVSLPSQFSLTGLTASTGFGVSLDAGSTWVYNGTSDASGEAVFTLTVTSSGTYTLGVYEAAVLKVSTTITVIDIVETIMPYITILITLVVIFGVVGMVSSMLTLRRRK